HVKAQAGVFAQLVVHAHAQAVVGGVLAAGAGLLAAHQRAIRELGYLVVDVGFTVHLVAAAVIQVPVGLALAAAQAQRGRVLVAGAGHQRHLAVEAVLLYFFGDDVDDASAGGIVLGRGVGHDFHLRNLRGRNLVEAGT